MRKVIFLVFVMLLSCSDKANNNQNNDNIIKITEEENILGNKNAKVLIVSYTSLSCAHCAYYHINIFPKIKEEYIDKGLVAYVARDFPFDNRAFQATILARCVSNDKFYEVAKSFFQNQEKWLFDKDYLDNLITLASEISGDKEQYENCLKDKNIEDKILKSRLVAENDLGIDAVPFIFINNVKSSKYDYESLKKIIDAELDKN